MERHFGLLGSVGPGARRVTRISFIVPTFNRADYLGEALAAIIAQLGPDDEVLVVDDGSTDETEQVVRAADPRLRYFHQENAGKAVALNRAMTQTDGEFVMICDDDDVLRPGAVAALMAALDDPDIGFAFGRYTRFRDNFGHREDLGTGYWPELGQGSLVRHIFEDAFVMQNATIVRRSAYAKAGQFSEVMPRSLDYAMFVRLAAVVPARFVDIIAFDQRKHEGARGPAAMLHAAASSELVWQVLDRKIFANLYHFAPLALFEAMFQTADPLLRQRAGLLQRATVMIRHGCWDLGTADLRAAAALSARPLDPGEQAICRRAFNGKFGIADLAKPKNAAAMRALHAGGAVGRDIVRTMVDAGSWRLRRVGERRIAFRALSAAMGKRETIKRLFLRASASTAPALVTERNRLEPDAYLPAGTIPPVGTLPGFADPIE